MEEVLAGAKSALRDLERLVDAQTLKLRTMRALSADPDVSCDESVVAASRLAETLARSTAPARRHVHRARRDTLDDDDDEDHLSASSDHHSSFPDRLSSSSSPTGLIPSSRRVGDARAVAKRRDVWPEHLRLFAATRLDADPTAVAMMPQRGEDDFPRYFVAGYAIGRVHVLRPDGDLAVLSDSATGSAVTSVTCALARKNETVIVSGHADGSVAFHRVFETDPSSADRDAVVVDDLHALIATVHVTRTVADARAVDATGVPSPKRAAGSTATPRGEDDVLATRGVAQPQGARAKDEDANADADPTTARVVALASYRVQNRRYFAAADATGKVVLFVDSGERVYAVLDTLDGPVVAFKPSTRRINWLTANGAGGVDPSTFEVRWAACAHLNGTTLASAAFDVIASSKFYAVSGDGEVITGFANPDAPRVACATRNRRTLRLPPGSTVATIKGYAFVATGYDVAVFNVTSSGRKPPRDVTSAAASRLVDATGFGAGTDVDDAEDARGPALVATNGRGRFVAVGLPGGIVATYESELPVFRPERVDAKLWSQPLFVAAMGIIALWQFYRQRSGGGRGLGGPMPMDFDPKMLEKFARGGVDVKDASSATRLGDGGGGGFGSAVADAAMARPGYRDFDASAFRREMERSGKWRRANF